MLSTFHNGQRALLLAASMAWACTDDAQDGKASEVMRGSVDASQDVDASGQFDQSSAKIALSCRSAVLTETETAGFLVKVTDAQGRVPDRKGLWVRLNPSTGTVSAAKAGGAETDANGEVKFAYVAPHFDFTTSIMLEASVIGDKDRVLAKEQCSFKVVTEAFRFAAPEKDSFVRAGRSTPVEIEVLVDGTPAACDDEGGVKLTLTGPTGAGLALSDGDTFERELCVDLIDQGRAASALIRGGNGGSTGRLRASLGTASAELPLRFVGQVAALQLSADATEVEPGSGANLSLLAIDDIGQSVAGVAIELALTRCAANGCSGGEAVTPETLTTDMNGKATAAYFAGNAPGAAQLTATVKTARSIKESVIVRVVAPSP